MAKFRFETCDKKLQLAEGTVATWAALPGFPAADGNGMADPAVLLSWALAEQLIDPPAGDSDSAAELADDVPAGGDSDSVAGDLFGDVEPVATEAASVPILHPVLGMRCRCCGMAAPCACGALPADYLGDFEKFDRTNPEHTGKISDVEFVTIRIPVVRGSRVKLSANPTQAMNLSSSENQIRETMAAVHAGFIASGICRTIGRGAGRPVDGVSGTFKAVFEAVAAAMAE